MTFTSRRFSGTSKPLLPLSLGTASSCPPFSDNTALASNASEAPMQAFKLPAAPLLHRIDLKVDTLKYWKENGDPQRVVLRPGHKRVRSLRLSSGSLYQRAYHQEPYPALTNYSGAVSPSPTELSLPPFASPTSPKFHQPPRLVLDSSTFWLSMYFCFNLGLTLYNKGMLVHFPFPYTLSALHALFGTIGTTVLVKQGYFVPPRLDARQMAVLVAFSVLYAVNIVVSNLSLQLVTVPFHQVVRASTPIFTILFAGVFFGVQSSRSKKFSLVPVVAGVGLATFGDYYFTYAGFMLTLLGTLLAALKTIFTNVLQSPTRKEKNHWQPYFRNSLDLLFYLSPLAVVECIILAQATGELARVRQYSQNDMSIFKLAALLLNGCIAFGLNVVSFSANRRVGAVGMTVAANVKQVITIVLAVFIFNLTITGLNAVGIVLTLTGGAWYAWIELGEKQKVQQKLNSSR